MADMPINPQLIRVLRERLQLTLQEAATRAGLKTRQQWYHIESGARMDIAPDTLWGVAKALGVSMDELMVDEQPKRKGK